MKIINFLFILFANGMVPREDYMNSLTAKTSRLKLKEKLTFEFLTELYTSLSVRESEKSAKAEIVSEKHFVKIRFTILWRLGILYEINIIKTNNEIIFNICDVGSVQDSHVVLVYDKKSGLVNMLKSVPRDTSLNETEISVSIRDNERVISIGKYNCEIRIDDYSITAVYLSFEKSEICRETISEAGIRKFYLSPRKAGSSIEQEGRERTRVFFSLNESEREVSLPDLFEYRKSLDMLELLVVSHGVQVIDATVEARFTNGNYKSENILCSLGNNENDLILPEEVYRKSYDNMMRNAFKKGYLKPYKSANGSLCVKEITETLNAGNESDLIRIEGLYKVFIKTEENKWEPFEIGENGTPMTRKLLNGNSVAWEEDLGDEKENRNDYSHHLFVMKNVKLSHRSARYKTPRRLRIDFSEKGISVVHLSAVESGRKYASLIVVEEFREDEQSFSELWSEKEKGSMNMEVNNVEIDFSRFSSTCHSSFRPFVSLNNDFSKVSKSWFDENVAGNKTLKIRTKNNESNKCNIGPNVRSHGIFK